MTYYICQVHHDLPAEVWTAESEAEIIEKIVGDSDLAFSDAGEAARYDMRDAYITESPLDLYHWARLDREAAAAGAGKALLANRDVCSAIEALATLDEDPVDPDATLYTAFDGRFVWNEDEREWSLGNGKPSEATSLCAALCEASLQLALASQRGQPNA